MTGNSGSLKNTVKSYLDYYAGNNSHTARAKRLDLNHFLNFLANLKGYSKTDKLKLSDWDHSSTQRFIDDALSKGKSPATVARRVATIKHMGRTLAERVHKFVNPAKEIKTPRINPNKPKALNKKEVKQISVQALKIEKQKDNFKSLRNRILFNFLLDTGLRADEVRLLKISQLDPKLEWIKNVRTKGRRYRNVYISSAMRSDLKFYLEERDKKLQEVYSNISKTEDKQLPVFISIYDCVPGKPETFLMGSKSIWRAINELSTDTSLHPHLLRHSYALDLLNSSNDVRLVAQALGHSDVKITMRYTERKDQEIAAALEQARRN